MGRLLHLCGSECDRGLCLLWGDILEELREVSPPEDSEGSLGDSPETADWAGSKDCIAGLPRPVAQAFVLGTKVRIILPVTTAPLQVPERAGMRPPFQIAVDAVLARG